LIGIVCDACTVRVGEVMILYNYDELVGKLKSLTSAWVIRCDHLEHFDYVIVAYSFGSFGTVLLFYLLLIYWSNVPF